MRREQIEERENRTPVARTIPGDVLPGKSSALAQGFDESLLDLQKAIGNRGVLRMLQQEAGEAGQSEQMDGGVRSFMESRFGADLSGVRIHRGGGAAMAASQMNSAAFTMGKDIFFGAGKYAPQTADGTQLLSHELAHVLQQGRGERKLGVRAGAAHEAEAAGAARGVAGGSPRVSVQQSSAPGIAKQAEPAPPAATAKAYQYTFEGKTVTLTEEEYKREIARTIHNLGVEFNRVEGIAQGHRETHQDFLDNTHNFFGIVSDIVANTAPPQVGIWNWPRPAINAGRDSLKNGKVEVAGRELKVAQDALRDAQREWNSYIEKTISGAQTAQAALETTRDISFAIAIGTAAVVAAPVVAAGVAAAGVTGVAGTAATGLVITAGGGVAGAGLRAGSAAAGQKLAFGHVNSNELEKEAKEGFKHGAIDAGTAFVTAGSGRFLGEGTSAAGKVLRHATAAGVGGGFSGGAEAISEGKSAGEVLGATGRGFASGFVGGGVTSKLGGAAAEQSAARRILSGTAGSVASGVTSTVLSGGSTEDVKRAVGTSLITGLATSGATHPGSHTPEETPPSRKQLPQAAERSAKPKEIPSNVVPPEKIEQLRLKKLAASAEAGEKASASTTKDESNVRSLEEMRQRKAAEPAKKPQPPTEAESQVQPIPEEQPAEAEVRLAANAGRQGVQTADTSVGTERRLKVVASAEGGSRSRPGGDLRGVNEFREREVNRRIPSAKERLSGPRSLSEHLEETGATKNLRDIRKGQRGGQVDEEAQLHRAVGKAIEPVEVEIFGGDLIAKGASSVHANHEFPEWIRKAFPKSAQSTKSIIKEGPDIVAIDEKRGRIVVGDVTAKPTDSHLTKTISDAQKIAANLPEKYQDYEIVVQERYYGAEAEYSAEKVVKPRRVKRQE